MPSSLVTQGGSGGGGGGLRHPGQSTNGFCCRWEGEDSGSCLAEIDAGGHPKHDSCHEALTEAVTFEEIFATRPD